MGCCNIQLFAVAASCFGIFTMIGLSEGAPRWSSAVHESNVATRLHHGSIMTSTPSTRRQLDGVAVGAPDSLVD